MDVGRDMPAVLVVMGVVQLAKALGFPSRFSGLLAVALGLVISLGYTYFSETPWFTTLIRGLAVGLSATGLYSTVKHVLGR
jgi:hypothetical protein